VAALHSSRPAQSGRSHPTRSFYLTDIHVDVM
jgi:hypothetical protein